MTTEPKKPESRLAKHLQILALDDSGFYDDELKSERAGIASMKPPALDLGKVTSVKSAVESPKVTVKRPAWLGAAAIALAAMVAVVVYVPKQESGYQVKGDGQFKIYQDVSGKVSVWDKSSPLANGTKLRVEFKAHEKMVGLVGVVDRNFRDLFTVDDVWQKRVDLAAGEVQSSSGSIELVGDNEGEALIVLACPNKHVPSDLSTFAEFWPRLKENLKEHPTTEVAGCLAEIVRLR